MEHQHTFQITEPVILTPAELQTSRDVITTKLQAKVGSCTKEYGYILSIDLIDFKSTTNVISRTSGNCIYTVSYTMTTIIPKPEQVYTGRVNLIFIEGIFSTWNNIKIIVPMDMIVGWTFEHDKFTCEDRTIRVGDLIPIKLTNVRYDNNQYQCIGILN